MTLLTPDLPSHEPARGLVLIAPGGGQDHTSPRVAAHARRLVDDGWAVAVVRSLDQVPPLLAGHDGVVGLFAVGEGTRLGVTLLTAEPRVAAAVLAPTRDLVLDDRVTAPVLLLTTAGGLLDDEGVERGTRWLEARLAAAPLVCLAGGPLLPPGYLGDLGGLGRLLRLELPDLSRQPERRCDRLVPAVESLRVELGVDRLDLLAHSAGANLAVRYAEHHPDRVGRLVLVTPSTRAVGLEISDEARSAVASTRAGEPWYAAAAAALARIQSGTATETDWSAIDPFTHGRWDDAAAAYAADMEAALDMEAATAFSADGAFDPPATRKALAELDAPVLVVAGTLDVGNPVPVMTELAALFPRGELVVQEGAGHYPWVDDPAAFTATVAAFLDRPVVTAG